MSDGFIISGDSVTFKDDDEKKIYTVTKVDRFGDSGEERTEYKLEDKDGEHTFTEKGLRPSEILIKVQPNSESQPPGSESQPDSESKPGRKNKRPVNKRGDKDAINAAAVAAAAALSNTSGGKIRKSRKDKSFKKKKTKKNVPMKKKRPKKTRRN